MMKNQIDCVICKMIKKEESYYLIAEDNDFFAFLDYRPLFKGHTLLAPKQHITTFYDLANDLLQPYFSMLQQIGKAVENGTNAEGSFIAMNNIVSQSIPHFHTHIIPRNKGDNLRGFFWPRVKYRDEAEIIEIQEKIRRNFSNSR